ncbi:MAG: DUF2285 domain-containing protein [Sphingorhabdus sp.]
MEDDNFQSSPPDSKTLTEYDENHLADYLRLLDADKENADWKEIVSIIFGIDPDEDESKAKAMHVSHLERAKWVSQSGYAQLLKKGGTA